MAVLRPIVTSPKVVKKVKKTIKRGVEFQLEYKGILLFPSSIVLI
jgi:hypothetical protein